MRKLNENLFDLVRTGPCTACERPINLLAIDFTATSVELPANCSPKPLRTFNVAYARSGTFMNVDVVSSESGPSLAKDGIQNAIKKKKVYFTGDSTPSHLSAQLAVNVSSSAGMATTSRWSLPKLQAL